MPPSGIASIALTTTPVIRVHDRVLLLPLVGAIDSLRAQQIMNTVLLRIVEEKAECVIIDIAGVAVVDTKVADNLVKTTASVRLLGAQAILTGVSAQVARTRVGKAIVEKRMPAAPAAAPDGG